MTHGSIAASAKSQAITSQRKSLQVSDEPIRTPPEGGVLFLRDAWRQALGTIGSAQFLVLVLSRKGSIGESLRRHAEAASASLHPIRVQQIAKCDEGVLNDRPLGI